MKYIKTCYYYLFYRFYKLAEAAPSRWWSEWKAGVAMTVLVVYIIMIILGYFTILYPKDVLPENGWWLILLIGVGAGLMNYFLFSHNERWRKIVFQYDALTIKKQKIGIFFFWLTIIFSLGNLVLMFYFMSKADWGNG